MYRSSEDRTFGPLAERIRAALKEPVSPLDLNAQEGAAIVLARMVTRLSSAELDRFEADYLAENAWTSRSFTSLIDRKRSVGILFALQIGRWFFEDGLRTPVGGIDEETGDELWPGEVDFAWLDGANCGFADAATAWATINGRSLADSDVYVEDTLTWLRDERSATVAIEATEEVERARAAGRGWALREAALWLETAANRSRLPWEPPSHEA